jgi:hypothetical protein
MYIAIKSDQVDNMKFENDCFSSEIIDKQITDPPDITFL